MHSRSKTTSRLHIKDFLKLIQLIQPRYWLFICGILLGAFAAALQLAVPLLARNILNQIPHHINTGFLIAVILLFVFSIILGAFSGTSLGVFGEDVVYRLRNRLWNKILVLPINYLDQHQSGQIASRLTNDSTQVKDLLANSLPRMITSILQLVGAMLLMLFMDWRMTLIMFVVVPLILFCLLPVFRRSYSVAHKRQNAIASLNAKVSEVLTKMRLVKSSDAMATEKLSGEKQMSKLYKLGVREAIYDSIVGPTTGVLMLALIVGVLSYGVFRISHGTMTSGTLMAFLMYLVQLVVPFTTLGQFLSDVAKTGGSTSKIQELLDVAEERTNVGVKVNANDRILEMNHVSFSYQTDQEILHDVSFKAAPNSVVAFVGPSGSGKTTIFSLLERFYRPDTGSITIGDTNLTDLNLANWRDQIGLVGQNADTMTGTIRYNLTYGLKKPTTDEEQWRALELAYAKDFVLEMPAQLETEIGENGVNISGGQRQRLSIARAFLRDPQLLMLDEATASLDPESEVMVQRALQDLMTGRTTLIIAHRINTIIDADEIYFIENGRVSGHGSHNELIKSHPLYRQYFNNQFAKSEEVEPVTE
ncbi:ABC transporter ATP-binding protein [Loigolactobacillus backii]|uniref:ABC transporter ATP-binding protein n=1 Tax=Loigolactobacillus backii TaxID=375175 RepID=UPI0007F11065|nr:ABC transporter ATP-binding protein [Loigolactobacillus backii]ANK60528.1 multidrug ABC transporter permease [Loigolactobacillus backii]ANK65479.1 multidrug ABC transporter permease [Loigolactobacillus backii]ANK67953.1 multidrug ABC transporter permease [Loigolactobacillus backii]MDA5387893.1 ABC transporter ATP-binding protein/permease [Loigolactobacillus backii]MDA5390385.1 ABC transporter ATP-binding protein/permease [Loigolactobacillus backii]